MQDGCIGLAWLAQCLGIQWQFTMQDGWIGLAWLAVPWYPVAVHHAGWVDWAGLVSSALVSSSSPPCGMGGLGWPG